DKTLLHVEDVVLYTEENVMPTLPEQVKGIFSDGTTDNVDVEWEEIDKELLETTGKFEVTGRVTDSIQATATVIVRGVDTIVDTIVATAQGKVPDLPSQVTMVFSTGNEKLVDVSWEAMDASDFSEVGVVEVKGIVNIQGSEYTALAKVTVLDSVDELVNIAVEEAKVTPSYYSTGDPIESVNDGIIESSNRWTNWVNSVGNAKEEWIQYEFENVIDFESVRMHIFTDGSTVAPEEILISTSLDG